MLNKGVPDLKATVDRALYFLASLFLVPYSTIMNQQKESALGHPLSHLGDGIKLHLWMPKDNIQTGSVLFERNKE
jgi:hypothetical protein